MIQMKFLFRLIYLMLRKQRIFYLHDKSYFPYLFNDSLIYFLIVKCSNIGSIENIVNVEIEVHLLFMVTYFLEKFI